MADEVTKRDLQSLQGSVNKQIAELKKSLDKMDGDIAILKDLPTKEDIALAKLITSINDTLHDRIVKLEVAVKTLQGEVQALKKA